MVSFYCNPGSAPLPIGYIKPFTAMYAVNVISPAQLPLVSGCRNSAGSAMFGLSWTEASVLSSQVFEFSLLESCDVLLD